MVNAQKWLDKWYPEDGCIREEDKENNGETRERIVCLNINKKELDGNFSLSDFVVLEKLNCCNNNLNDISFLSTLVYPKKLSYLNIGGNNFPTKSLNFLGVFVNLKELYLGNPDVREENKGNEFSGSLKSLGVMKELKVLGISNTNIDSGLEYLPKNLKEIKINCTSSEMGCSKIKEKLKKCLIERKKGDKDDIYNLEKWRKDNETLIEKAELEVNLSQIQQKLQNYFKLSNELDTSKLVEKAIGELNSEKQHKEELETQIKEFQQRLQPYFPNDQSLTFTELIEKVAKKIKDLEVDLEVKKEKEILDVSQSEQIEAKQLEVSSSQQHLQLERQSVEKNKGKEKVEKNAQQWLKQQYPYPREVKNLDISNKNLEGDLDLSSFANLNILDCSKNQLTSLNLSGNLDLIYLDCSFNKLEKLSIGSCLDLEAFLCNNNNLSGSLDDLLSPSSSNKLSCLNVSDNNLWGNLSCFKDFVNLEFLWIGGEEKVNKFSGSLESLKGLDKLESVEIVVNNDISGSSRDLPKSIREFCYSIQENSEFQETSKTIKEDLESFKNEVKKRVEDENKRLEELEKQEAIKDFLGDYKKSLKEDVESRKKLIEEKRGTDQDRNQWEEDIQQLETKIENINLLNK